MFRVNAFTQKGIKYRFRVQGNTIAEVHRIIDEIFKGKAMRLVLVEPV